MDIKLSKNELETLSFMQERKTILVSQIETTTSHDFMGRIIPGMTMFKKLIKKGILFQTIEDSVFFDDESEPFEFTESIELTEEGEALIKNLRKQNLI